MEIIDDKPKKKLPQLQPGDVIKAELDGQAYFYMIVEIYLPHNRIGFLAAPLTGSDYSLTVDGLSGLIIHDEDIPKTIEELINTFRDNSFIHIEKVELEARMKHGN